MHSTGVRSSVAPLTQGEDMGGGGLWKLLIEALRHSVWGQLVIIIRLLMCFVHVTPCSMSSFIASQ